MRADRERLLKSLQILQPGLSPKESVEQSSCFVFTDNRIVTFNDEVACCCKSPAKGLTGAVSAKQLMELLTRMTEDEVDLQSGKSELIVKGKRRSAGIRMESEIALPFSSVEQAKVWRPVHEHFVESIALAAACASSDETQFEVTCVRIHPKWVEACNEHQAIRCRFPTGFENVALARCSSIKHIIGMGAVEFSETETWLHFRNANKDILSCRRFDEEFPDLKEIVSLTGKRAVLPKGLADAADKAAIFLSDVAPDDQQVLVKLGGGKLTLLGEGTMGWYRETKKCKYDGKPIEFLISPRLLIEIVNKYTDCRISDKVLRVDGSHFTYCASLGKPGEIQESDSEE